MTQWVSPYDFLKNKIIDLQENNSFQGEELKYSKQLIF